jgi:hypothetical protein
MVTLMNQNSSFGLFEDFSKDLAMGGMESYVTTLDNFGGRDKSDINIKSK